jgi:hypothetical protein
MYPGVPLESYLPVFKSRAYLAIPKSVRRTYPDYYNTKFYGFISRCTIPLLCISSIAMIRHAKINSYLIKINLFMFQRTSIDNRCGIVNQHLLNSP